jgi:hypothetical protein
MAAIKAGEEPYQDSYYRPGYGYYERYVERIP